MWKTVITIGIILAIGIVIFIFIKKAKEKEIYCGKSKSAMKKIISEYFKKYWTDSMTQYLLNFQTTPSTNYEWYQNIKSKADGSGISYAEQVPFEVKFMWESNRPKLSETLWREGFIVRFLDENCNSVDNEYIRLLINETLK